MHNHSLSPAWLHETKLAGTGLAIETILVLTMNTSGHINQKTPVKTYTLPKIYPTSNPLFLSVQVGKQPGTVPMGGIDSLLGARSRVKEEVYQADYSYILQTGNIRK